MRIAVCLSGHMRTFAPCAATLRSHVLDGQEAEFFVHTWQTLGHSLNGMADFGPYLRDGFDRSPLQVTAGEILESYPGAQIVIEDFVAVEDQIAKDAMYFSRTRAPMDRPANVQSMWRKIHLCDMMPGGEKPRPGNPATSCFAAGRT
jgi:hypothetical protein